jgi:hypothetical protein
MVKKVKKSMENQISPPRRKKIGNYKGLPIRGQSMPFRVQPPPKQGLDSALQLKNNTFPLLSTRVLCVFLWFYSAV